MDETKKYTLALTRQQYSDIMLSLGMLKGSDGFIAMHHLYSQLETPIKADVDAEKAKQAEIAAAA